MYGWLVQVLVEQCQQIKAVDPTTKCFVYRNTGACGVWYVACGVWRADLAPPHPSTMPMTCLLPELALEWLEPQRAVMYDPSVADYFLQYLPGNPKGVGE